MPVSAPLAPSLIAAVVAALVTTGYVLATNHIWEDYFITFRHSQNLAAGHGLVFQPGERVHGFTSPLGVLLPAGFAVAFGSDSYEPALLAFRIVSIAAFSAAVGVLVAAARRSGLAWPFVAAFGLFLATEPKSVAFATNGMETAFVLLFLAVGLAAAANPTDRSWVMSGLAWAGLMWSRPDGVVPICGLAVGTLATAPAGLRSTSAGLARSAVLAAAIYLPWIGWAWWYYGSPIPHTILAKASHGEAAGITAWLSALPAKLLALPPGYLTSGSALFEPIYHVLGGWPGWVPWFGTTGTILASTAWLVPGTCRLGKTAAAVFITGTIYLHLLYGGFAYPWYMPPFAWAGIVAALCGLSAATALATARLAGARWPALATGGIVVAAFAVQAFLLLATTRQIRVQQREIEFGTRKKLGEWLASHVAEDDAIYTECLGYLGYFSGRRIDDYPGLVSPRVVAAKRTAGSDYTKLAVALRPAWIVARTHEARSLAAVPGFLAGYEPAFVIDAGERLSSHAGMPGIDYLLHDSRFIVLRRKDVAVREPSP
jgi:hypothetical protein